MTQKLEDKKMMEHKLKKEKKNAEKLVAVQSANNLLWNSLWKFQLLCNAWDLAMTILFPKAKKGEHP